MLHLLLPIIYIAFISLGLPDALLGSAWPTIYPEFQVPVSYAGIISMIISGCTILSSLMSDRLTHRFGAGKITAASVGITAAALLGFSISDSFLELCLWAIPYGLGAGNVDAALNNFVALHYASRHMSWLHCMWGIGASTGPYVMGFALNRGFPWSTGYLAIGILQIVLTAMLFFSLPLWKTAGSVSENPEKNNNSEKDSGSGTDSHILSLPEILAIPGAKEIMITFFCYCALEQTAGLWASSYLVLHHGLNTEAAAFYASLFYLGITAGRALNGFLTIKFKDAQLIRMGQTLICLGTVTVLLSFGSTPACAGLIIIGLGCAPIYPCIIHSTPEHFGAEHSQALIGVQMASAYVGSTLMPPVFGLLANHLSIRLFPVYLLGILLLMIFMHERLLKKQRHNGTTAY